jgi:hypothetical protein
MVLGKGLTLTENVGSRKEGRGIGKVSLGIDVSIITHDPCHIVFLACVVEGFIRVDGHVSGPIVVAPVHSDDDKSR